MPSEYTTTAAAAPAAAATAAAATAATADFTGRCRYIGRIDSRHWDMDHLVSTNILDCCGLVAVLTT
jgi:hypothetical protein